MLPAPFTSTLTPRGVSRAACWLMIVLPGLGLLLLQSMDALLTAAGLLFLDIRLELPLLGPAGLAYAVALALGIVAVAADLTLANAARIRRGSSGAALLALALATLLLVQGLGGFLHYTQLSDLARGSGLQASLVADAAALRARVAAAQAMMADDYARAVATQARLAADSAAGNDITGAARRGPLWQAAKAMERRLKAEFADLSGPASTEPESLGASAGFAALQREMDRLRERAALYGRMCAALQRTCTDPVAAIVADPAYPRLAQAVGGEEKADRHALVLARVGRDVVALARGEVASVQTGLLLALVLILPFAQLFLVVMLRAAVAGLRREPDAQELREAEAGLDAAMEWEARINAKRAFREVMARGTQGEAAPTAPGVTNPREAQPGTMMAGYPATMPRNASSVSSPGSTPKTSAC